MIALGPDTMKHSCAKSQIVAARRAPAILIAALEPELAQPSKDGRRELVRCVREITREPLVATVMIQGSAGRREALWYRASGMLSDSAANDDVTWISLNSRKEITVNGRAELANRLTLSELFLAPVGEGAAMAASVEWSPRAIAYRAAARISNGIADRGGHIRDADGVRNIVRKWAVCQVEAVVREWATSLNPIVLALSWNLEKSGYPSGVGIYNFVMRRSPSAADSSVIRNRRQFVESNSILSEACLVGCTQGVHPRNLWQVATAVDRGTNLRTVVCEAWNISSRLASWLIAPRTHMCGVFIHNEEDQKSEDEVLKPSDLAELLAALDPFPAEFLPENPREILLSYKLLVKHENGPGALARVLRVPAFNLLQSHLKKGWSAFAEGRPWQDCVGLRKQIGHAIDAFRLVREVIEMGIDDLPVATPAHHSAAEAAMRELVAGKSLLTLLNLSEAIHSILQETEVEVEAEFSRLIALATEPRATLDDFPPLLSTRSVERSGVTFQELTTFAELRKEGREMAHCVGIYGAECMRSGLRVISLRGQNERATLAIRVGAEDIKLEQLQGRGNASVSQPFRLAAIAWVNDLNDGAIAADRAGVTTRPLLARSRDSAETQWNYDRLLRRRLDRDLLPLLPMQQRKESLSASLWDIACRRWA